MLPSAMGIGRRFRDSTRAFAAIGKNPNLRWLELAWAASVIGNYAFLIAVSVYAYGVGGEQAVGLIFLARLVPAALIAPFAGILGDRYSRQRVLLWTNAARIVLVGAAALAVFADLDPLVVYLLSIAATIANTPFRSAQAALTPSLARTPEELTAANAVASGVESIAVFAGPAIAGILLGLASTGTVFTITALLVVLSAFFLLLIRVEQAPRARRELDAASIAAERLAGFTTLWKHPPLRVMSLLLTAQTMMFGAVNVFIVVTAIEELGLGEGGVGYLNASLGIGAFIGAVAALSLTGARRLSPAFLIGLVVTCAPLIALGLLEEVAVAVLVFAVMGIGNSFVDIAGFTLIQRAVPDDVLARVFGVIQMLWMASMGVGAAIAPALISGLGLQTALIATGLFLPLLVVLFGSTVARIDASAAPPETDELRVLAAVPIFAPLPGGSLEHLAARLAPLRIDPGTVVVREGDTGDRFYIVAEGELDVTQQGESLPGLGAGDYFGEIALMRDVPRTATVTARTPVVVYALDREDFLATVTGHPQSAEAVESVVSARLAGPGAAGYRTRAE